MSDFKKIENAISDLNLKQYVTIKKTDIENNYISHFVDYSTSGEYFVVDIDKPKYYVEYLESRYVNNTKQQFVNTGIVPKNNLTLTLEFTPLTTPTGPNWEMYCGTGLNDISNYNIAIRKYSTTKTTVNIWYGNIGNTNRNYTISTSDRNTIILKNGSVNVNGINNTLPTTSINNTRNDTIYLFAGCRHDGGDVIYNTIWRGSSCKIYYFKIENTTTGEILCEYLPCVDYKENPAFYDTVTKTLKYQGNSNADNFIVGERIVR